MLKNIKSHYFQKIVFSIIDQGKMMEIIKYNKRLQNMLKINIKNYQAFSGRYIIYEN